MSSRRHDPRLELSFCLFSYIQLYFNFFIQIHQNFLAFHNLSNSAEIDSFILDNDGLRVQRTVNWYNSDSCLLILLFRSINSYSVEILDNWCLFPPSIAWNTFWLSILIKVCIKIVQKLLIILPVQQLLNFSSNILLMILFHELTIFEDAIYFDNI